MKQYHYSDGTTSYGPFSLEELKTKNISSNTLIWTEDLITWTKAKDVSELSDLFPKQSTPPNPFHGPPTNYFNTDQRPPKTYLIESILTTIFCCLPLGIVSIIYAANVEKKFERGDISGAEKDSKSAKKWMTINIVVSIILWFGWLAIFGLAMLGGILSY